MRVISQLVALGLAVLLLSGCTFYHSKQALVSPHDSPPHPEATFVQEEDSGLAILGLFELAQPDHYAVLIERARRRYRCSKVHHAQLDFFTDYWLFLAFPISRVTLVCDPPASGAAEAPAVLSGTPLTNP